MALNALPYDPALFGTSAGASQMQRLYPQWMTDAKKRGIGVGQDFTATVPGLIAIPSGPMTEATQPVYGYQPQPDTLDPFGGAPARGGNMAEGGGASGALGAEPSAPTSGGLADFLANFGITNPGYGAPSAPTYDGTYGPQLTYDGTYGPQLSYDGSYGPQMPGAAPAPSYDGSYGPQTQGASTMSGGQTDVDAEGAASAASANGPGSPDAASVEGLFRGGVVTRNRLTGPNPPGPDDGYAALNAGEGVLTKKAMDYYGADFLRRLNKLQVPKGR